LRGYESYLSFNSLAGVLTLLSLSYVSYQGILDNAENRNPSDKSLVGGAYLDLFGVIVLIEFGTVLWSPRFYWLLLGVPIGAGWKVYSTFAGGTAKNTKKTADSSSETTKEDETLAARRQQRAEKRRQKRA